VAVAAPRRTKRLIATIVCLGAIAANAPARAGVPPPEEDSPLKAALIVAGVILLPSDIGVFLPGWGPDFTLGWSYQLAFTPNRRHRLMVGLDLIPTSDSERWRMRGGYRYAYDHFLAGLTVAYAREHDTSSDTTWSPEIGVRFGPQGLPFGHLLARAEIPIALDGFRGVALLLGWDLK
jgi:hypothetical protein